MVLHATRKKQSSLTLMQLPGKAGPQSDIREMSFLVPKGTTARQGSGVKQGGASH